MEVLLWIQMGSARHLCFLPPPSYFDPHLELFLLPAPFLVVYLFSATCPEKAGPVMEGRREGLMAIDIGPSLTWHIPELSTEIL